ncbi:TrkH family potassium uptake protein [Carnobacteriaceae bacterium zg-ZUI240]|nr:TrkH family potassium uptake protein [Carnobacteriaceae bacterium zg-ZUI240]
MNRRMIAFVIGRLLVVEAGFLMLPLSVALLYQESMTYVTSFLWTILITGSIGFALSHKQPKMMLRAREGAVIVALGWILLSFFGALPFVFSGDIPHIVDAFFETASGFTTTGSSILSSVDTLAHSTLFWRSFTHLVGGMGVLAFTLAILPSQSDSAHLLRAEVPGPTFGKIVSKVSESVRILYIIYLVFTAIFTMILVIFGGVPIFDATLLAFGTAGTGGFAIRGAGFAMYGNPVFVEYAIAIGMLVFGVNFNLYYYILIKHIKAVFHDEELRWYIGIVAASVIAIMWSLSPASHHFEQTFREVLFTVASIVTTTGYATADFNQWNLFAKTIILLLMFVGACAGSTAGGIKVSRVVMYMKSAVVEVFKTGHPHRVMSPSFNGKRITDKDSQRIANYLLVYILCFIVVLLSVSIEADSFTTAFSSVATTFNNIGPGLDAVGPTQNFAFYSDWNKLVLSLSMIAGRLEILPMFVLFAPSTIKKMLAIKK